MAVWGGLINSCGKKRTKKQRRKGKKQHLNAEFQRIARRDKKVFLRNQYKEMEETNRIKDSNGMDLTEAEDIKKRWQEYTENCTKKIFMTQIITMV